jgi:hypothetical protein
MTEKELARAAARRLAIIRHAKEVTGNVSMTCRYYGITLTEPSLRGCFVKIGRAKEQIDSLDEDFASSSRKRSPIESPNARRSIMNGFSNSAHASVPSSAKTSMTCARRLATGMEALVFGPEPEIMGSSPAH